MEYEIVTATAADSAEILALYKAQLGREFCPWDAFYPTQEEIDYDLSRDSLFVLKGDGRIKAAISVEVADDLDRLDFWDESLLPVGELVRLAVLPEEQNKGLARVMLRFGLDELKRRGFRGIRFLVNKHNVKAIRSYASFGFHLAGEAQLYEQDFLCYEGAL